MKISEVIPNLKEFVSAVSHEFPANLDKMIVFGSYARGEATIRSDVDIALVFDGTDPAKISDRATVRNILDNFDNVIEFDLYYTNQINVDIEQNKMRPNYWIREEGMLLWAKEHINI